MDKIEGRARLGLGVYLRNLHQSKPVSATRSGLLSCSPVERLNLDKLLHGNLKFCTPDDVAWVLSCATPTQHTRNTRVA